jgi:hypothetical protein
VCTTWSSQSTRATNVGHGFAGHGKDPRPSAMKREVLCSTVRQRGLHTLVETGTFRGDTVRALRSSFRTIYSIELDDGLYQEAVHRCRNQRNARLLRGDSAVLMPHVLRELRDPALSWLDAHWSGLETATSDLETPILAELKAILAGAPVGSVVHIDDHRNFVRGATDYPSADSVEQSALAAGRRNQQHVEATSLKSRRRPAQVPRAHWLDSWVPASLATTE